jgi:hypothetical protein
MVQMLILRELPDSPPPHRMWLRLYMVAHPEAAQQYSQLKRELAAKYPQDIQAYMDGKDQFIRETEQKALVWSGGAAKGYRRGSGFPKGK